MVSPSLVTTGCDEGTGEFDILCEAVDLIREHYVDPVDEGELAKTAADAIGRLADRGTNTDPLQCALPSPSFMVLCEAIDRLDVDPAEGVAAALVALTHAGLDPNSSYIDPQSLVLTQQGHSGQVEGIGAMVSSEDHASDDPANTPCPVLSDTCLMVIVSTFEGSPAEAAGLLPNDVTETVDGIDVRGLTLDEVTTMVRGHAGTEVRLGIRRGSDRFEVTIVRAAVVVPVVETEVVGDTGYLRLHVFTTNSDSQVRDALDELLDSRVSRIVFDLRDNPGGALDAAVEIASQFLEEGLVLRTQSPVEEITYTVNKGGVATDPAIEVLLLVNRGSASASEVVAGALQEAHRATVIGYATFGKNTVQQRFPLSNGGALKLTIARWVTPSGHDFGEQGIIPDITAELDPSLKPVELVTEAVRLAG